MLTEFAPKESKFKANLLNGRAVEVTLRPFTLLDHAWFQQNFTSEQDLKDIQELKVDVMARIIWRQMDDESKKIFNDIEFKGTKKLLVGHERFLEALYSTADLLNGFTAFAECRGDNSFIDVSFSTKKKTFLQVIVKTLTNLLKSMTWSQKNTD